jgi:hypothetical protein
MPEKLQLHVDGYPNVSLTVLQNEQALLLNAGIPVSLTTNAFIASVLVFFLHSMLNVRSVVNNGHQRVVVHFENFFL